MITLFRIVRLPIGLGSTAGNRQEVLIQSFPNIMAQMCQFVYL